MVKYEYRFNVNHVASTDFPQQLNHLAFLLEFPQALHHILKALRQKINACSLYARLHQDSCSECIGRILSSVSLVPPLVECHSLGDHGFNCKFTSSQLRVCSVRPAGQQRFIYNLVYIYIYIINIPIYFWRLTTNHRVLLTRLR